MESSNIYIKHKLQHGQRAKLAEMGLGYCPGKWCPDKTVPLETLNKVHYCKVCSSMNNKISKDNTKKRKQNGEESYRSKIRKIRDSLPADKFLCVGPGCGVDGKILSDTEMANINDKDYTCKSCAYIRYTRLRKKLFEIRKQKGVSCLKCGEDNPVLLELNHTDPSIKNKHPSNIKGIRSLSEEMEKIEHLCVRCHRDITKTQWNSNRKDFRKLAEEAAQNQNNEIMRKCSGKLCKESHRLIPVSCFHKDRNGKDGLNYSCKFCSGYRQQQIRETNYSYIHKITLNIGKCQTCGYEVIQEGEAKHHFFEFDHFDPRGEIDVKNRKVMEVSRLAGKSTKNMKLEIESEISKCTLLCVNCHRLKTAKEFNWISMV